MKNRWTVIVISTILAVTLPAAVADDLAGADRVLCSAVEATVCVPGDGCEIGAPWLWEIPQFIEIDFETKRLSTTAASGEDRFTPIKNLVREDGLIVLQGVENARAFSLVIKENSGMLSAAVAREEVTVSVFGACTPLTRQDGGTP